MLAFVVATLLSFAASGQLHLQKEKQPASSAPKSSNKLGTRLFEGRSGITGPSVILPDGRDRDRAQPNISEGGVPGQGSAPVAEHVGKSTAPSSREPLEPGAVSSISPASGDGGIGSWSFLRWVILAAAFGGAFGLAMGLCVRRRRSFAAPGGDPS